MKGKHNPALNARAVERATEAAKEYLREALAYQNEAMWAHEQAKRSMGEWADSCPDHWRAKRMCGRTDSEHRQWLKRRRWRRREAWEEAGRHQRNQAGYHEEARRSIELYLREERWLNANA